MLFYWKKKTCFGSSLDCLEDNDKAFVSPVICHNNSNMVIFFLRSRKIWKYYYFNRKVLLNTWKASVWAKFVVLFDCMSNDTQPIARAVMQPCVPQLTLSHVDIPPYPPQDCGWTGAGGGSSLASAAREWSRLRRSFGQKELGAGNGVIICAPPSSPHDENYSFFFQNLVTLPICKVTTSRR